MDGWMFNVFIIWNQILYIYKLYCGVHYVEALLVFSHSPYGGFLISVDAKSNYIFCLESFFLGIYQHTVSEEMFLFQKRTLSMCYAAKSLGLVIS